MSTSNTKLPSKYPSKLDAAVSALTNSNLAMLNSLIILGTAMSKAEVIAKLESFSQLFMAVTAARQAYASAVAARKVAMPSAHAFFMAFESALKETLGPSNQGLLPTFGASPTKTKKVITPEAEPQAVEASRAWLPAQARGPEHGDRGGGSDHGGRRGDHPLRAGVVREPGAEVRRGDAEAAVQGHEAAQAHGEAEV